MERKTKQFPAGLIPLGDEEMKTVRGGNFWLNTALKLVQAGMVYCFNMGIREAKRVKGRL